LLFWASSEVYAPAGESSELMRRAVEPRLNRGVAASILVGLDCELRYVPIIMPASMLERYPTRSRLARRAVYTFAVHT